MLLPFVKELYECYVIDPNVLPTIEHTQAMTPQYSMQSNATQPQISPLAVQPAIVPAVQMSDKRWRPEDVGYFNGDSTKVRAFVDRLSSVATIC